MFCERRKPTWVSASLIAAPSAKRQVGEHLALVAAGQIGARRRRREEEAELTGGEVLRH